jgi:hypothetical protein
MLTNTPPRPPEGDSAMWHFRALDVTAQAEVIRRLAASGMGDYTIASATRLSVEFVRRILAEHASN